MGASKRHAPSPDSGEEVLHVNLHFPSWASQERCKHHVLNYLLWRKPGCMKMTWKQSKCLSSGKQHHIHGQRMCKTMLIVFIHTDGLVHWELIPRGQSVNTKFYKTALSHLCSQTMPWEVVHQLLNSAPWQYLASQVCYHKQIFWRNNISLLPHHPYSSDLAPSVSSCSHMLRKQWNVRDSMQSKRFKPTWQANMGYYRCLSEMLLRLTWTLCNKCVQSPTLRELKPTCW